MSIPFSADSPWLVLAPHLRYPLRNGGDILMANLATGMSYHVPHVVLITTDTVRKYSEGKLISKVTFLNDHRSKQAASLQTLLLNGHYLQRKFNTVAFKSQAINYLENPIYKTVLHSYISTTDLLKHATVSFDQFHMICPQNDEFKWFEDLQNSRTNALVRLVARQSNRWLTKWFRQVKQDFLFLHVTPADASGFDRYFPDHKRLLISIGADDADLQTTIQPKETSSRLKLLFIGSLSSQMNYDALTHFGGHFYPTLAERLGNDLLIQIVGSNPTLQVQQLCKELGWQLHANVDDATLGQLLQEADFSILPFAYVTGAKLKLLKTLAIGLPFLGTAAMATQLDDLPVHCLLSDDPQQWADHLMAIQQQGGVPLDDRIALQAYTRQFSWRSIASKLYSILQQYSQRNRPDSFTA